MTQEKTYQAAVLPQPNQNIVRAMLSLKIEEKPLRQPQPDELLVSMEAAPFNPSDIAFMQDSYQVKKQMPCVPGFEGAGIVVEVGSNLDSKRWLNKRVSCFSQQDKDGTWAEYFYAKANEVLPVSDKLSAPQAATFFVNPFTAWGLFEIALQRESTAIIVNAAGGRVADFLFEIAKIHEVEAIAIVRKQKTATTLLDRGLKNVLVEGYPDFEIKLREIAIKLNATTAFDAVGGSLSGQIFNLMPPDSEVILYGGLSGKAVSGLNPLDLIFQNKMFTGFNLNDWMAENDAVSFEVARETLEKMIVEERISTKIQQEIPLAELSKGLRNYISAMSEGKVVI
ncbi:MAG: alcohol dehydrogenase catalytic domain-containing protein, partial [Bacteroidales bacterium]|nr:alcohol dehydrogenase catalytic domain-containing protein [Bacteroidales bacterium]